jgi:hypothetical protein
MNRRRLRRRLVGEGPHAQPGHATLGRSTTITGFRRCGRSRSRFWQAANNIPFGIWWHHLQRIFPAIGGRGCPAY